MQGARIIVAASGMMNGGRVLHHALRLLPEMRMRQLCLSVISGGHIGPTGADGEKQVKVLVNGFVKCRL